MTAPQVDYEAILAREGLSPIDRGGQVTHAARNHHREWERGIDSASAAVSQYLEWAAEVAARPSYWFETQRQRQVWALHAGGLSHNEISRQLGLRRRTVTAEVSAVKFAIGRCPPNPWRKSGKEKYMAKDETAVKVPNIFRYARILMREPIEIKGRHARHDRLEDVDARPHAGGMDIILGADDFPSSPDMQAQVITVPWWRIKQADRTVE